MKKLKLGIIGLSEGNGHPYSWSSIFNGYNKEEMDKCPFPVIPEYLSRQLFPGDFLTDLAAVTHIWTQDEITSNHVALASRIPNVVKSKIEMLGQVDGILLARDDAEFHFEMAIPFIEAGLPIFIDKPFSLTVAEANKMLLSQHYDGQIFTCSALRYAKELHLTPEEQESLGPINYAEGSVMKKWETYGIHILEPLVAQFPNRGRLISVRPQRFNEVHLVLIQWENLLASLKVTGSIPVSLTLGFYGKKKVINKTFFDSFSCFREAMKTFVDVIVTRKNAIDTKEVLELVTIIEKGRCLEY